MALAGPSGYDSEPGRYPALVVNAKQPYNAETPSRELALSVITPVHAFFVRNHGPVPVLQDAEAYRLSVGGLLARPIEISLRDIQALPKVTVTASLQCAGNRRTEMSLRRTVKGVGWGLGAVGTAEWSGATLASVLELAGVPPSSSTTAEGGRHVEFVSVDQCKEEGGGPYRASIPLAHATSPERQVLVAYEMNGEELTRDHGYPLRIIVPGVIGARSVKWLQGISVRGEECDGFFQQRDYKMFPPSVDWDNVQWHTRRPIMDFPIQSAITQPCDGDTVAPGQLQKIKGYALSGGGRKVERVDVSVDGGRSWQEATRLNRGQPDGDKTWHWVLWELDAVLSPPCELVVKAVDEASSTQPESWSSIWNLRGVLNNSWHRVHLIPSEGSTPPSHL